MSHGYFSHENMLVSIRKKYHQTWGAFGSDKNLALNKVCRNTENYLLLSTGNIMEIIHAFNKSGRHLEFSMNDVIRGKIMHVVKMATKDESSVDVDFAVSSYKKECFYFISRGIFSLYNVFIMGMLW